MNAAINAVAGRGLAMDPSLSSGASSSAIPEPFSGLLKNAIAGAQGLEDQAAQTVQGLMRGDGVDVHAAMIATQKADLVFELALAVRNKAVAAYQTMLNMQF
jgi:flagellar hook-basal body complex protein FliE